MFILGARQQLKNETCGTCQHYTGERAFKIVGGTPMICSDRSIQGGCSMALGCNGLIVSGNCNVRKPNVRGCSYRRWIELP